MGEDIMVLRDMAGEEPELIKAIDDALASGAMLTTINNSFERIQIGRLPDPSAGDFAPIEFPSEYNMGTSERAREFMQLLIKVFDECGVIHSAYVFQT